MKHLLAALLVFAMLAGCTQTEEDAPANGSTTETSSEEPLNGDGDTGPAEEPANEPGSEATNGDEPPAPEASDESTDDANATSSASGLSPDDLVGEWIGTIEFDEEDRGILMSMGAPAEQIDQMVEWMATARSTLILNSDMSFTMTMPSPDGSSQTVDSTWSVEDDGTITLIMKSLPGPTGASSEMPASVIVSEDKTTLEMGDPTGMTKSKSVYKRK